MLNSNQMLRSYLCFNVQWNNSLDNLTREVGAGGGAFEYLDRVEKYSSNH